MDTIHTWISELYNQVCKQTNTAGALAHQDCEEQEKEIIQHFKEMWDDKRYDVYHLLVSVDDPDNLFTADELYISGATAPYHQETEEMDYLNEDDPDEVSMLAQDSDAYSESEDDGTATVQESTDAEIWEGTASVMISSDWDYQKLVGLSRNRASLPWMPGERQLRRYKPTTLSLTLK